MLDQLIVGTVRHAIVIEELKMAELSRRAVLIGGAATTLGVTIPHSGLVAEEKERGDSPPKKVAGVVTIYRKHSHADVILGKILEGWEQLGGAGPRLKLASLYVDQFPDDDMSRGICKKYGVPLFDSIEKAVTVGGTTIPVDGVISIGEHGDYPHNERGQHLYPRRRFFEEITATFDKYKKVVPVFNDKHLGPAWEDATWMYERAKQLRIPFMAGSSLPVGYRKSEITVPLGCEIEAAVGIGYSGLDVYGIHALEFFQSVVEKRRGGERGVKSVQFLSGPAMWKVVDEGLLSQAALDAAFALVPKVGVGDIRADKEAGLFLFEYLDGLWGGIFMLGCAAGTAVAIQKKGEAKPLATVFDERSVPRHPHFAYLLKAIERMVYTGRPTYPVERTLLTSGILDRALRSRAQNGTKLLTPELAISYQPIDYPHAPEPSLISDPTM